MYLIGDVHGKINDYIKITSLYSETIQIGDFGLGTEHKFVLDNVDSTRHKVLFGNHDDYSYVNRPHSLGHFGIHNGMFFVRGAYSIDRHYRYEGVDYWREEELNFTQANKCIELYDQIKPNIVISHDCPYAVYNNFVNESNPSQTAQLLDVLFDIHQPELWYFGHHHKSKQFTYKNTYFRCLAELEVCKLGE